MPKFNTSEERNAYFKGYRAKNKAKLQEYNKHWMRKRRSKIKNGVLYYTPVKKIIVVLKVASGEKYDVEVIQDNRDC